MHKFLISGSTPLHYCCGRSEVNTTFTLILSGADLSKKNHQDELPFHLMNEDGLGKTKDFWAKLSRDSFPFQPYIKIC